MIGRRNEECTPLFYRLHVWLDWKNVRHVQTHTTSQESWHRRAGLDRAAGAFPRRSRSGPPREADPRQPVRSRPWRGRRRRQRRRRRRGAHRTCHHARPVGQTAHLRRFRGCARRPAARVGAAARHAGGVVLARRVHRPQPLLADRARRQQGARVRRHRSGDGHARHGRAVHVRQGGRTASAGRAASGAPRGAGRRRHRGRHPGRHRRPGRDRPHDLALLVAQDQQPVHARTGARHAAGVHALRSGIPRRDHHRVLRDLHAAPDARPAHRVRGRQHLPPAQPRGADRRDPAQPARYLGRARPWHARLRAGGPFRRPHARGQGARPDHRPRSRARRGAAAPVHVDLFGQLLLHLGFRAAVPGRLEIAEDRGQPQPLRERQRMARTQCAARADSHRGHGHARAGGADRLDAADQPGADRPEERGRSVAGRRGRRQRMARGDAPDR